MTVRYVMIWKSRFQCFDEDENLQDTVKALFADAKINKTHRLAAINSINTARILAQITYYFHSYFSLLRSQRLKPDVEIRFVVPTGTLP